MKKETIRVEGMSCMHCVKAIGGALEKLKGVKNVDVDLNGKVVNVEFDESTATLDAIKNKIEELGYDVI